MTRKLGKMVGSFGEYCIFKTEGGYVVRLETLFARRPRRGSGLRTMTPGRRYTDINSEPVATLEAADDIIADALIADALAHPRARQ